MSETIILNSMKTHFDDDGDLLPEFGSGTDNFNLTIPQGMRYGRYEIRKLDSTSLFAGANVTAHPPANATGRQTLKVKWHYELFGKIRYAIKVFAESIDSPSVPLRINLLSSECLERATEAINQKKSFSLFVNGELATRMWDAIKEAAEDAGILGEARPSREGVARAAVVDDIALGIGVIVCIISVASLATLTTIALYAIGNGYDVKARHKVKGLNPFDNELEILVTKGNVN